MLSAIAVNVDYAFKVHMAPAWVKPGRAHYWSEPDPELSTAENHFAECLVCRWVVGHNATRREAEHKYGRHFESEHR